ncbi:MAG: hypothetical protein DRP08_07035 [Candidatus Aenigmatarchaeota archaeon]|nr:MAG: hypothetical protein DRP08_07035 [Candidatus Aenigmarchaeota archaeon]
MTGPGEGKILLDDHILLYGRNRCTTVPCDVYLHVIGFIRGRVTHIDLENDILNLIVKPGESKYCKWIVRNNILRVFIGKGVYVRDVGFLVRAIGLDNDRLISVLGNGSSDYVYVGGKLGGIFLGFRKKYILRLEELAKEYGFELK